MPPPETDKAAFRAADILAAIGLLTRLPVRLHDDITARGARAAWAYPLAGAVVAGLAGVLGWAALALGLTPALAAGLALAALIVVTGALHEDGLADCADGFWGGWTRDRRLEIMKDSRIGAYGVLALVLGVGLRWAALTALFAKGWVVAPLIIAAMGSRAAMPALMAALPHARDTGLSHQVGRPDARAATVALALGLLAAVLLGGLATAFWATAAALLSALAVARLARARIGGQTGDVLGATQQCCEIAILLALVP
ncbi:adenosylcobinamide-GDP ribazoletransferase [Lutimaribacter sp. EGI FJ00015]|uniref:Adenosylcobinamide-GDP ribazoletransferase n=1 Tax=Lutimaribacter degradans TaxID=2945989 RepID=A0ACC5ZTI9_9RHOB|nr:adenosylcobinamide-GDP ribazoletransferase [Lutimaribacter sp. EGI FJ00013]MCM2561387.1 adenosylcobinamide-GDP ribazoletransferase [Lutimaribacter sp. EGI FJ00013]MCO0612903.1 adenosylcobinamide-GDP ribazoletransferase [Lutimaribacter sp. EGI FJ00015]MCO0635561.1 adenosylcobinamide-GDP ribazoletransferase [Lutimaribacter sp. EGI FJ00014]